MEGTTRRARIETAIRACTWGHSGAQDQSHGLHWFSAAASVQLSCCERFVKGVGYVILYGAVVVNIASTIRSEQRRGYRSHMFVACVIRPCG